MSTASSKRRNRNRDEDPWGARKSVPETARPAPAPPEAAPELPEGAWLVASLAVLALAAFLRLYALELKPMHHDEGVNGFFLTDLVRQGRYAYNPENYHGPTLYYLSLPLVALFGLNTFAVRLLTALFGVATVGLVLSLRRHLGAAAALAGAALVAVSPGAVFYSRYYIHETLFVFFTLGIVVAALRFYELASAWHLTLLAASAAMLFATKETAFISVGTLLLAALVAWAWARLASRPEPAPAPGGTKRRAKPAAAPASPTQAFVARLGGGGRAALLAGGAAGLFVLLNVLFYSSFFTNEKGVDDALEALKLWTKTGTSEFHKKPEYTYVNWLWQEEAPLLILAAVGSAVALFERRKNRLAVFAGAWAFGMLAAYSLIPYKTPWLALSFVVPLGVAAGYGVQALGRLPATKLAVFVTTAAVGAFAVQRLGDETRLAAPAGALGVGPGALQAVLVVGLVALLTALGAYFVLAAGGRGESSKRAGALAVAAVACAVCAYQAWVVNFREYDNDRYPYVYSHSQRGMLDLIGEVERLAERTGRGKETGVSVASPEYWPLPWYLRDYTRVGYHGSVSVRYDAQDTPIVIGRESSNATEDQLAKLRPLLAAEYRQVGTYDLRPGVRLALFARRDLAGG